ncbi:MAG: NAD(P)-dependent oxidoreductase [bacterium]|nr:NAD(P)-dependent oxidoreductase [bacterium]
MKILITEPQDYSPKALAAYKTMGEVVLGGEPNADTEVIVIRLKNKIDKSWMDKMPKLKVIASPTTGLNHIDVAEAEKRGIKLVTLRGHTEFLDKITSTAEETLALILALARKIPQAHEHVKAGGWNRDQFKGHQLAGQILGILGLGRLGKMVARYANSLGMKVIAADPAVDANAMSRHSAEKVSMEELFKKSDVLSVHVLLTEATQSLIKEDHLKLMKPTAHFINTARAEIVEKGALEKALRENWIAGAAVDVMWDEEGSGAHLAKSELWDIAKGGQHNLIIVPHIGGATYDAMQITEEFIADLVKKELLK